MTGALARRLYGDRAAVLAVLLTASSSYQVFFAQEVRLQALSALLTAAAALTLKLALDGKGVPAWVGWTLCSTALLYTYYYGAFAVIALAVAALAVPEGRRQWKPLLVSTAAATFLFLPWARTAVERLTFISDAGAVTAGTAAAVDAPATLYRFSFGYLSVEPAGIPGMLVLVIPVAAVLLRAVARGPRPAALLLGAPVLLPLFFVLVMPWKLHSYEPRHLMLVSPLFLTLLAGGIAGIGKSSIRTALLVFWIAGNAAGLAAYYRPEFVKEDWRSAAAAVAARENDGDVIFFSPPYCGFAFDYYYRGTLPRAGMSKENFSRYRSSVGTRRRRVWLVEDTGPVARPDPAVGRWLEASYRVQRQDEFPGMRGLISVRLFERRGGEEEPVSLHYQ